MESIKSSTELPRHTITLQRLGIGGLWAVIVLGRKFAFLAHVEASTRGADSIRARAESQIREGMSPAAHLNSIRSAWRALARGRTFFSAVSARKNWTVLSDNRRGKSRWIRSGETSTRARRPPKGYLGQQVQAIIGKVDGRATLLIFADQNSTIHWNFIMKRSRSLISWYGRFFGLLVFLIFGEHGRKYFSHVHRSGNDWNVNFVQVW